MAKKSLDISGNITPTVQVAPEAAPKPSSDRLKQFVKEESVMVKGRFRNLEYPGASHRVMIRKYKDLPMFDKWMRDGDVYEVPLYVARHLNGIDVTAQNINGKLNSCSYPTHGFMARGDSLAQSQEGMGPSGQPGIPVPIVGVNKWNRRFAFESLEFDNRAS